MLKKNDFTVDYNEKQVTYDYGNYFIIYYFAGCEFYASDGLNDGTFSSFDDALEWINKKEMPMPMAEDDFEFHSREDDTTFYSCVSPDKKGIYYISWNLEYPGFCASTEDYEEDGTLGGCLREEWFASFCEAVRWCNEDYIRYRKEGFYEGRNKEKDD